jgi:hypothetical protein
MTKRELREKIQKSIFTNASRIMQEKNKKSSFDAPDLSSEEIERIVFDGNSFDGIQKKFNLREAVDSLPKVTTAEIKEFENAMEQVVASIPNATIAFDTQDNGHFMKLLMNTQGAEAFASGSINMPDNGAIKWIFSLQNGMKIMADQPVAINQENKAIITTLQDYYSGWQQEWREKMSKSSSEVDIQTNQPEAQVGANPASDAGDNFSDANPQVGAGMAPVGMTESTK